MILQYSNSHITLVISHDFNLVMNNKQILNIVIQLEFIVIQLEFIVIQLEFNQLNFNFSLIHNKMNAVYFFLQLFQQNLNNQFSLQNKLILNFTPQTNFLYILNIQHNLLILMKLKLKIQILLFRIILISFQTMIQIKLIQHYLTFKFTRVNLIIQILYLKLKTIILLI
ncbi:unnamed protein product [Paramecium sonneborni]|uniref:Transmembrane protein n=1 Tax=Paramecium sonneborni TaxID=65129 RepID=A0A8S1Q003_9CILI|nr:unnamed protein product [Paramecium sonneborni]